MEPTRKLTIVPTIYSVYYSDTLESYGGILCEIGGIEVEALTSGKTEIVNP